MSDSITSNSVAPVAPTVDVSAVVAKVLDALQAKTDDHGSRLSVLEDRLVAAGWLPPKASASSPAGPAADPFDAASDEFDQAHGALLDLEKHSGFISAVENFGLALLPIAEEIGIQLMPGGPELKAVLAVAGKLLPAAIARARS